MCWIRGFTGPKSDLQEYHLNGARVGKFLPERKKPVAKTGNNQHGKNLLAKMAKTGKNFLG